MIILWFRLLFVSHYQLNRYALADCVRSKLRWVPSRLIAAKGEEINY